MVSFNLSLYYLFLASPGIPEIDICFAISTLDSDADETFKKMKEAVSSIIEKYKDYDRIHYSVIAFGTEPSPVARFGEFDTLEKLKEYVMSIRRPSGQPDLEKALDKAVNLFNNASLRPRARKFLVVFVGSKTANSLEMLKKSAKPLEDQMIKVIAVAVGTESDPNELIKIVPNKGNLIKGDTVFNDPEKMGEEVMDTVLKSKNKEFVVALSRPQTSLRVTTGKKFVNNTTKALMLSFSVYSFVLNVSFSFLSYEATMALFYNLLVRLRMCRYGF